jgi:glycosyltransferase involved in cell wall biosynthesis
MTVDESTAELRGHAEALRATPAQVSRFRAVDEGFDLGLDIPAEASLYTLVEAILSLDDRPSEFRACLALLAAVAVYPTDRQVRELTAYLDHGRDRMAVVYVLQEAVDHGRMAAQRVFRHAAPLQVDVTSVSRETAMTGIPRVVVSLIRGAGSDTGLHVWSHGAAGPATMESDGTFAFDPDIWSGTRAGTWPYSTLRRWYRRLRVGATTSTSAAILYRIVLLLGTPLVGRLNGGAGPLVGLLFVDGEILLPEVCQPDVADRMRTFRRCVGRTRVRVFVHDLLPLTAPAYFPSGHPEIFLQYLHVVVAADVVVTTTAGTAAQVRALADLLDVAPPAVHAVPLPVTARDWDSLPIEPGFVPQFTCVGSLEPRKNHRALIMASIDLAQRNYPVVLNLVGNKAWADEEIRELLAHARASGVDVRMWSSASDAELRGLMEASAATVFMSWSEGYGLPVLESLAIGVPVIASDVVPIRDFADYGGVRLVDPHDHLALAATMQELIDAPAARQRLAASIRAEAIPTSVTAWAAEVLGRDAPARAPERLP